MSYSDLSCVNQSLGGWLSSNFPIWHLKMTSQSETGDAYKYQAFSIVSRAAADKVSGKPASRTNVQVSSRKELGIASVPHRGVVGAKVCKIDLASQ